MANGCVGWATAPSPLPTRNRGVADVSREWWARFALPTLQDRDRDRGLSDLLRTRALNGEWLVGWATAPSPLPTRNRGGADVSTERWARFALPTLQNHYRDRALADL